MNYYFTDKAGEKLLIGRSYADWNFLLNVVPKKRLFVWDDWERLFLTPGEISAEDGVAITRARLRDVVLNRECYEHWEAKAWQAYDGDENAFHVAFFSERGDRGLLRLNENTCPFLLVKGDNATWDSVLHLDGYTLGTYCWDYTPPSLRGERG